MHLTWLLDIKYEDNTHNCVFNLSVHQKSAMLIGNQWTIFTCKNVCKVVHVPGAIFTWSKVCQQSFTHGINYGSPTPISALHNLFQLLKLKSNYFFNIWNKWKSFNSQQDWHFCRKDWIGDRLAQDFQWIFQLIQGYNRILRPHYLVLW